LVGKIGADEEDISGFDFAQLHRRGRPYNCGELITLQNAGNRETCRRTPGSEEKIHFVGGDQLFVQLARLVRVRLIVVVHELDRALCSLDIKSAACVDAILPDLKCVSRSLRAGGKKARSRNGEAYSHRVCGPGVSMENDAGNHEKCSAKEFSHLTSPCLHTKVSRLLHRSWESLSFVLSLLGRAFDSSQNRSDQPLPGGRLGQLDSGRRSKTVWSPSTRSSPEIFRSSSRAIFAWRRRRAEGGCATRVTCRRLFRCRP